MPPIELANVSISRLGKPVGPRRPGELEGLSLEFMRHVAAIRDDRAGPDAYEVLVSELSRLRRDSKAIELAFRGIEKYPDSSQLRYAFCYALADAGRFNQASAVLSNAFGVELRLFRKVGYPLQPGASMQGIGPDLLDIIASGELPLRWEFSRMLGRISGLHLARTLVDAQQPGHHDNEGDAPWPLGRRPWNIAVEPFRKRVRKPGDPLLSIMLPVRNPGSENYFRASLESVLAQDMGPDWAEIVVLDDASSTDTARRIASGFGDRITYHHHPNNLGLVGNHNACLAEARGAFIHILHQDDLVEPGFYDAVLPPLLHNSSLSAAFSATSLIGPQDELLNAEPLERADPGIAQDLKYRLLRRQRVQFASIVVRRRAYETVGGFTPSFKFSFDWEMWVRLADLGPVWFEPQSLARHRVHGASVTHSITPLDRLLDVLRTQATVLKRLPASIRPAAAEIAFAYQLAGMWQEALKRPLSKSLPEIQNLRRFLEMTLAPFGVAALSSAQTAKGRNFKLPTNGYSRTRRFVVK